MPPPGFLKSNNNTEEWASWWTEGKREGGKEHFKGAASEVQDGAEVRLTLRNTLSKLLSFIL